MSFFFAKIKKIGDMILMTLVYFRWKRI